MEKAGGAKPGEGRELGVSSVLAAALWLRDDGAGWGQAGDDPSKIGPPPPFRPAEGGPWLRGHRVSAFSRHLSTGHFSVLLDICSSLLSLRCPQIMLLETARRYNHETECITFLKDFTYSKDDFHRAGTAKCSVGSGVPAGQETQGLTSLSELPSLHLPTRVRAEPTPVAFWGQSEAMAALATPSAGEQLGGI